VRKGAQPDGIWEVLSKPFMVKLARFSNAPGGRSETMISLAKLKGGVKA